MTDATNPAPLPPKREGQLRALLTAGEALSSNAGWALLDELDRVRAERGVLADRIDTFTAVAKGNKRHVRELANSLHDARRQEGLASAALAEVLRIVSTWCVEANEVGGVDAGDLARRLGRAGHPLPDEDRLPSDWTAAQTSTTWSD
ncbi:hypothetical protein [Streptomyces cucumeris]|uniref:hypothetical protein n=1 Tax=Streptomyces cucumeris TaxID=2962890 RepID=UPI0020C86119|nr:hypothetical protein [Streptomyces sp. NEAU-Y11]MCP9209522.1 hypothetical protein [Streptomyces sp. NEAU-Y11]